MIEEFGKFRRLCTVRCGQYGGIVQAVPRFVPEYDQIILSAAKGSRHVSRVTVEA